MRPFANILLFLFIFIPLASLSQGAVEELSSFPAAEEVYREFYRYHPFPKRGYEHFLEKRPQGYFMGLRDPYPPLKVLETPALIWSVEQGYAFKRKNPVNDPEALEAWLKSQGFMLSQYQRHPFYGYDGWDAEVIRVLGGEEKLPDKFLNGLGRAYSHAAGRLFHNRSGNIRTAESQAFLKDFNPASFSSNTLEQYDIYTDKALETFKRLDEQNPGFPLIVGYPRIKWANEHMSAYLDYAILGMSKRALEFILPDLYPEAFLAYGRNMLASCPQNAVLFTNGDNDTYPLLYVQKTEQFREDVTLVNYSLINTPEYIHHVTTGLPKAQLIRLGLSMNFYKDEQSAAVVKVNAEQSLPSEEVVKALKRQFSKGEELVMPAYVSFAAPAEGRFEKIAGTQPLEQISSWAQRNGNTPYWLRAGIFLIDFLNTNGYARPVCFGTGVSLQQIPGLEHHLWQQGIVSQLLPLDVDVSHPRYASEWPGFPHMDVDATARLIVHNFDLEGLESWAMQVPVFRINSRNLIKITFQRLFYTLFEAGEYDRAPELIGLYNRYFFKSGERSEGVNMVVAEYAYAAGLEDDAGRMAESLYADAARIGTDLLQGHERDPAQEANIRSIFEGLADLFENLGIPQRGAQSREFAEDIRNLSE